MLAARLLLEMPERPTAILCFSDVIAYGVVQEANALGFAVPDDLSVVGFDDNPLAQRMRPALTTVRQDVAAKGHAAAAALTAAIERSRTGSGRRARHVLLPTELIIRDSTAKPSSRMNPLPSASSGGAWRQSRSGSRGDAEDDAEGDGLYI